MAETILYISYNGITEPLVHSQVLNYLKGLVAQGYHFVLLTFEKSRPAKETEATIRQDLLQKGIDWYWLPYHNQPQLLGTAWDVHAGTRLAVQLIHKHEVKLMHARSFVPALIARKAKERTGVPFINDIRGFWVDEKAYKGSLRKSSKVFQWGKKLEQRVYLDSDAVVSLSNAGLDEIRSWSCWQEGEIPPMQTIPTCVDLDAFTVKQQLDSEAPVFGYVGSLARGYLGREVFRFFRLARELFPGSRLLIVSRTELSLLENWCREEDVDSEYVEIISVTPEEVPAQVARMDVGLSFIEPHYSKKASCPTKLGEYFAAGLPVVANAGIGDTDVLLNDYKTGILLDDCSDNIIRDRLPQLKTLMTDPELPQRCRTVAEKVFSLEYGVSAYALIYKELLSIHHSPSTTHR